MPGYTQSLKKSELGHTKQCGKMLWLVSIISTCLSRGRCRICKKSGQVSKFVKRGGRMAGNAKKRLNLNNKEPGPDWPIPGSAHA